MAGVGRGMLAALLATGASASAGEVGIDHHTEEIRAEPRAYAHLDPLLADQAEMDRVIRQAYAEWSAAMLHAPSDAYIEEHGGAEMLFVTGFDQNFVGRPEKGAVSEGVGYGLVITALMDDWDAFARLWNYAETKLNDRGLMTWLWDDEGYTVDFEGGSGRANATDADLDAAYGLILASVLWEGGGGRYTDAARALIANILEHNVTDEGYLTSGDDGYDEANERATLNRPLVTSYASPGYFRLFADFTGNARWDEVAALSMAQLRANQAAVRAANGGEGRGGDGLVTFRMLTDGAIDPVGDGNVFHADAARTPWRVATDYAWYGTPEARDFLQDFNGFVRREGMDDLVETYDELGTRVGQWGGSQAGWMAGPVAASMMMSDDPAERERAWAVAVGANDESYFTASTRLLGLLTAAGWYVNPLAAE